MAECAEAIRKCPPVTKTRVQIRKADLAIGRGGVSSEETTVAAPVVIEETDIELPDLLTDLQDKTRLTRRSIVRILTGSGRLDDFKRNPQQFIELATESINRTKRLAVVDGIRYHRIGDAKRHDGQLADQNGAGMAADDPEFTAHERPLVDCRRRWTFDADAFEHQHVFGLVRRLAHRGLKSPIRQIHGIAKAGLRVDIDDEVGA